MFTRLSDTHRAYWNNRHMACMALARVRQNVVSTKWRIYKGTHGKWRHDSSLSTQSMSTISLVHTYKPNNLLHGGGNKSLIYELVSYPPEVLKRMSFKRTISYVGWIFFEWIYSVFTQSVLFDCEVFNLCIAITLSMLGSGIVWLPNIAGFFRVLLFLHV